MLKRCNVHIDAQRAKDRGFCALEVGHTGKCNIYPADQGIVLSAQTARLSSILGKSIDLVTRVRKALATSNSTAKVKCLGWTVGALDGCGAELPIAGLTYIQTHWYTEPYSCVGGDYWNLGEGEFVCPECGKLNRLYERPQVEALKEFFKDVKDTYTR